MAGFCVILSGRLPGDKDDASVWAPLKAAFKLDDTSFAQRILAAVPLIVRQNLDEQSAIILVQKMAASGIDATEAQVDAQLAYFERGGTRRGPVPHSALAAFIRPGERYRLRGAQEWIVWGSTAPVIEPPAPEPLYEPAAIQADEAILSPADEVAEPLSPPFLTAAFDPVAAVEASAKQSFVADKELPPPLPLPVEPPPAEYAGFEHDTGTDFPGDPIEDSASPVPPTGDPLLTADLENVKAPSRSRAGLWVAGVVIVAIAAGAFAWSSMNHDSAPSANVATLVGTPPPLRPAALVSPARASSAQVPAASSTSPAAASSVIAQPATAGSSRPASATTAAAVTVAASPDAGPHSSLPRHCEAGASNPQAPEEVTLLANGQNHLTGRNVRAGPGGEIFIVEAALGYDAQCRPSPYQIYVFSHGKLAGTLSPQPMQARTDGAISDFKLIDPEHLQIDIERYKPGDTTGSASSHEQVVVDLHQFIDAQKTAAPSPASPSPPVAAASATTAVNAKVAAHPSFD